MYSREEQQSVRPSRLQWPTSAIVVRGLSGSNSVQNAHATLAAAVLAAHGWPEDREAAHIVRLLLDANARRSSLHDLPRQVDA